MEVYLDSIIVRLQQMPAFELLRLDAETGLPVPWWEINAAIVSDLVVREEYLRDQVQAIPAQIAYWGRLEAQARRVWEVTEREYRRWRDTEILRLVTPPVDDPKWKKPTEKAIEAAYRSQDEYAVWQLKIEKAEESFNAVHAILDGFRAKKDMLRVATQSSVEITQRDMRV